MAVVTVALYPLGALSGLGTVLVNTSSIRSFSPVTGIPGGISSAVRDTAAVIAAPSLPFSAIGGETLNPVVGESGIGLSGMGGG